MTAAIAGFGCSKESMGRKMGEGEVNVTNMEHLIQGPCTSKDRLVLEYPSKKQRH